MRARLARIGSFLLLVVVAGALPAQQDVAVDLMAPPEGTPEVGPTLDERDLAMLGDPLGPPLSGPELAAETERVSSLMRCPVCQGLSVADSHTDSALAMRDKTEVLLAAGYSDEQVLTYFESSYGEFIRLLPRAEGFNLLVWIVPALGLLLGLLLVLMRTRSVALEEEVELPVATDEELDAYRQRVRREVTQ